VLLDDSLTHFYKVGKAVLRKNLPYLHNLFAFNEKGKPVLLKGTKVPYFKVAHKKFLLCIPLL
jgi:hypothetical protein